MNTMNSATKEAPLEPSPRRARYWLLSSVALLSFLAGYCLVKFSADRILDPAQVSLAAEGVPNQSTVTFDQAVQALSLRH
jgi:anti-sigma-K factor RskA